LRTLARRPRSSLPPPGAGGGAKGLSQRVQRDPARKAAGNACAHIGQMRASRQTDGSIPVV
jgi:hypothetical protein